MLRFALYTALQAFIAIKGNTPIDGFLNWMCVCQQYAINSKKS